MLFFDLVVIIVSLILGSFFNVVAIRLLKKESITFPPSNCPSCHHRLGLFDLFPLFSYLLLKGRCRYCNKIISLLYPLGELLTVITNVLIFQRIGLTSELLPAFLLSTLLILSVLTDIREKVILDIITLPSIILFIIVRFFVGEESFLTYISGGLIGFGLLLLLAVVSKGGVGGGDIKLYAAIGVVLGPQLTIMSIMFASFIGAIVGIVLISFKFIHKKEPIPFGPSIMVGTIVAYLYGKEILNWYISILM
ncbi:prepilin peptidase [Robertmurraya korlensis]|uniref:prepilin peptidase n=1 Tax=Robertmurraya korlensis TaxID=519977 RepID=UPI000824FFEC|nr:A24 family peptidase [Robertmurraya korlensis]